MHYGLKALFVILFTHNYKQKKLTAVEKSRVAMRYGGLPKVEYAGWTTVAGTGWPASYPTFARPPYLSPRNIL